MMKKTKKINTVHFALFQGALGGLLGLLAGILYSFGGLLMDAAVTLGWITSTETPGLSYGTLLAFGALIGMPLLLAAAGFTLGVIEAVLYNLFSRWFKVNVTFKL